MKHREKKLLCAGSSRFDGYSSLKEKLYTPYWKLLVGRSQAEETTSEEGQQENSEEINRIGDVSNAIKSNHMQL
ncbi:hypothetical protein RUM43_002063 [Polyplax serrata]|uniref:Uncharacterized protein n=1 Tax=Polyplax serrata TaxID=468196 RepID=A0AAN8S950_POLSC